MPKGACAWLRSCVLHHYPVFQSTLMPFNQQRVPSSGVRWYSSPACIEGVNSTTRGICLYCLCRPHVRAGRPGGRQSAHHDRQPDCRDGAPRSRRAGGVRCGCNCQPATGDWGGAALLRVKLPCNSAAWPPHSRRCPCDLLCVQQIKQPRVQTGHGSGFSLQCRSSADWEFKSEQTPRVVSSAAPGILSQLPGHALC